MGLFSRKKATGFMNEIRCDEPSYLVWKWHPAGSALGETSRENAIRWGSPLRVKEGEVAVFVYKQPKGNMLDFIEGPFDKNSLKQRTFLFLLVSLDWPMQGELLSRLRFILST